MLIFTSYYGLNDIIRKIYKNPNNLINFYTKRAN